MVPFLYIQQKPEVRKIDLVVSYHDAFDLETFSTGYGA
jgi:hypothetical protein